MGKLVLLLSILISAVLVEQQPILESLKQGEVEQFGSYFADEVIITIFEKEQTLSKLKAVSMTKNFFNAHEVSGFRKIHEGTSKDNRSSYLIGMLVCPDREFRTFIYYRLNGEIPEISEVQIEKE